MIRTRPTGTGKLFLGFCALFYVASVTSQSGLLLLFIGLIGGCFAVNWSFSRRNARHVEIVPPGEMIVTEGSRANAPWQIFNGCKKHLEVVEIHNSAGLLFRFPTIQVGSTHSLVPDVTWQRRGIYRNDDVRVRSAAPFGLIVSESRKALPGKVIVLPKIYSTDLPAMSGLDQLSGGKHRGQRRVNSGTHFAGVREWNPGDSLRQIHWKTSARRDRIMVKTFEEELSARVTVILDTSGEGTTKRDAALVDSAVRAAGSLGAAVLEQGHHLEFVDASDPAPLRLPPFSDEGELLVKLAGHESQTAPLPSVHALSRKSNILLVGVAWRPEWKTFIDEALQQNRRVFVYLPDGAKSGAEAARYSFDERSISPEEEESVVRC